jgi:thiazole synthase
MDELVIAGRAFNSRLIVGTGKYKNGEQTRRAIEASGAEIVTVAVRRVNLDRSKESLLDFIDPHRYFLLPNTAGCYTADEAVRTAMLGREVGLSDWVKVEVIGDQKTLFPDVQATIEATRTLVKEGFTVLPYTSDDVVVAKRLLDAGASAIMPLGAPIGSGLGIQNSATIRILREMITDVPLIVDAGVGTASDATVGSGCCPDEYCNRQCRGSRAHGRGDAARCYRRSQCLSRRPYAKEAVCYREFASGRRSALGPHD